LLFPFCCRHLVLHLRGGGREKKRPKRDIRSSHHPIPDSDDPLDSDFNIEEEIGSKKVVPYKRRFKNALNAPISHQSTSQKCHREPSSLPPSSSLTSQSLSSSRGGGGDESDEDEEQERDESDDEDKKEEKEGHREVESEDEGLEYNSGMVVYHINMTNAPTNQKWWKEDRFKAFHEACELK
jgi:hypothetical protein